LLNVAATAGLALVAADGSPDKSVLTRVILVMLCAQSAIGVTNDVFDRELDARTKPWKPLVSGVVPLSAAIALALGLIAATAALALTLGALSFALAMLGMACGLAYDIWFKRSVLSALPFMVAIPTLPIWVWVTLGEWEPALWWLLPLGALIGLSLHLANTLPDIDDDLRHGVRGLAHRLGPAGSAAVGWSSFAVALAISVALAPMLAYDLRIFVPTAVFGVASLAACTVFYALRRDDFALQVGFGVIGIASAVVAVGWLAALT
jgi:4-hydroxybenzoate polyprenyltransferase